MALALPLLEAMTPVFSRAAAGSKAPKRMLCIMTNMGVMPRYFFPKTAGRNYETTPYLELIKEHREQMTIFSGLSHPGVAGNHSSEHSFLSCAPGPGSSSFRNSISVDQFAAEQIGDRTRFPSMTLLVGKGHDGLISQTRDGVAIPPESRPSALYRRLFVQGTPAEIESHIIELKKGGSILDFVSSEAKGLQRNLGARDKERVDQYFTSVRDLEQRLVHAEEWERKPKPVTKIPMPQDIPDNTEIEAQTKLMYDMIRVALETDSSRLISLYLGPLVLTVKVPGVNTETHSLTHHGNDEAKIAELKKIEETQFRCLSHLLAGLRGAREESGSLLDNTMVLYGSNLSNANAHDTHNLPVILAGGGFKHGQHVAYEHDRNTPLANLFVTMLQQLSIGTDKFASSTGTLTGLEKA
ncbi:MAG: DUF1552 domain-containing protein [Verrucomicrobiaceae bacterium]